MSAIIEKLRATILDRIENEADAIGEEMDEYIRNNISIPVQYIGGEIIRSELGEDPRRETGHLWSSQRHEIVRPTPKTITLRIINDAWYARRLEYDLGRPFFTHAMQDWLPDMMPRVIDAIKGTR